MTKKFKIENEAYDYFYEQIKDTHKYLGLLLNRETMLYEVRTSPPKKRI